MGCSEEEKARAKKYRQTEDGKTVGRRANLKRLYNLTLEEFDRLWALQQGKCKICGRDMLPEGKANLSVNVDHDQDTGRIRGLLCHTCNVSLGWYETHAFEIECHLAFAEEI